MRKFSFILILIFLIISFILPYETTYAATIEGNASFTTHWYAANQQISIPITINSTGTNDITCISITRPSADYSWNSGSGTGWTVSTSSDSSTLLFDGGPISTGGNDTLTVTINIPTYTVANNSLIINGGETISDGNTCPSSTTISEISIGDLEIGTDADSPIAPVLASTTATSTSTIEVISNTGSDILSGLHNEAYLFTELTGAPGGLDSNWQNSTTYINTGLSPSTMYCYSVKHRDATGNETALSTQICATTPDADTDNDGLTDNDEINIYNTDPNNADSDSDNFNDGNEVNTLSTNPLDINDPITGGNPNNFQIDQGVINGVTSDAWTIVNLNNSYTSMVVLLTANYDNSAPPMVPRIETTGNSQFQIRLDRVDGTPATQSTADIHYIVINEGIYNTTDHGIKAEIFKYNSTITDENNSWLGESKSYYNSYTNPVVLGQVMSYNDTNFSVFWARGNATGNPPSSTTLYVGKNVAEDPNNTRANETVAYAVFESGFTNLGDTELLAGLGADNVAGITNNPPYTYTLSNLSGITAATLSAAAIDGGNGGWPILYGANPLSNTAINIAFDEDQLNDSERNHTTEQVAYLVSYFIDSDGDGLGDNEEINTHNTDPNNSDSDGDGLNDYEEVITHGTNPNLTDTDGDSFSDYLEVTNATDPLDDQNPGTGGTDTDGDGLSDIVETLFYGTNPNLADTDNDGLNDYEEINTHSTDPNNADSDSDGLNDGDEINTHSTDPNNADSDGDTLSDGDEINTHSTNPNNIDTDSDNINDNDEITKGTDPLNSNDPITGGNPNMFLMEGGNISGLNNQTWTTVNLDKNYSSMVPIVTLNYDNSSAPIIPRVRIINNSSFEVLIDLVDGTSNTITNINAYYIVGNEGYYFDSTHKIKGEIRKYNSTITDRKGSLIGEQITTFHDYTNPVVLGQVISHNDTNFSVFWARGSSSNTAPSTNNYWIGKQIAEDPNTSRANEELGYMIFEEGLHSILNSEIDINFRTGLGGDSVRGILNTPPYIYFFTTLANINSGALSIAALDGGDGGWPIFYGNNALSDSSINTAFDEDTLGDADRSHTTEQLAYLVLNYQAILDTDNDGISDNDEINIYGTNPNLADADGDGLNDGDEINTHSTDPNLSDTDNDGLNDGAEINTHSTNPNNSDSDNDGLNDGDEINIHLTDPNNTDSDSDTLSDYDEITIYLTDPNLIDTDGDTMSDSFEITNGTDPLTFNSGTSFTDSDNDGLSDVDEINIYGTDPENPDTDSDGYLDGHEINIGSDPLDPNDPKPQAENNEEETNSEEETNQENEESTTETEKQTEENTEKETPETTNKITNEILQEELIEIELPKIIETEEKGEIGSTNTLIPIDAPGETRTLQPIIATPGDTNPPQIILSGIESQILKNNAISFEGNINDTNGVIESLQISLDGGKSSFPATSSNGIGTANVEFAFDTEFLADGKYEVIVYAFDNSENKGESNIFEIIIDKYDPYIGSNLFTMGALGILPNENLIHESGFGLEENFYVAVGGGANEVKLIDEQESYNLEYIEELDLWTTSIKHNTEGYRFFKLIAKDHAGNEKQKEIDTIYVHPKKLLANIEKYKITIYNYKSSQDEWTVWDAEPFGQTNPIKINGEKGTALILPSGEYYFKFEANGYRKMTTNPFSLDKMKVVTPSFKVKKDPQIFKTPIIGKTLKFFDWGNKYEFNPITIEKTEELEKEFKRNFLKTGDNFPKEELLSNYKLLKNEETTSGNRLYSFFPTWNPFGTEQLDVFENLENNKLTKKITVLSTLEPNGLIKSYLNRGLDEVNIAYDRIGFSSDSINISSAPYHYLVSDENIILKLKTGVLSEKELTELIYAN